MPPSPRSHIYRLILVLIVALAGFVAIKGLAVPRSWDYHTWYRRDALPLLQSGSALYGGNESCRSAGCHEEPAKDHDEKHEWLADDLHKGLACEACHGPLHNHVADGRKIADADIVEDSSLCLRCHEPMIARPEMLAQFNPKTGRHETKGITRASTCLDCHDPHEPSM
jgi:hypothetical protein